MAIARTVFGRAKTSAWDVEKTTGIATVDRTRTLKAAVSANSATAVQPVLPADAVEGGIVAVAGCSRRPRSHNLRCAGEPHRPRRVQPGPECDQ
jgi:hypothetical protein